MKYLIFDLDLTLVNTSNLEEARKVRNWRLAYSLIHTCELYEGLDQVFNSLRGNEAKVAIVSTSPRPYIEKIVSHFSIPAAHIIGYHDAKPIKPHPAPMIMAMNLLGATPEKVISFGDRTIDIIASNAAGIESVACLWGSKEKQALMSSNYKYIINQPLEILKFI